MREEDVHSSSEVYDFNKEFENMLMSFMQDDWLVEDSVIEYIEQKEYENACKEFTEDYELE